MAGVYCLRAIFSCISVIAHACCIQVFVVGLPDGKLHPLFQQGATTSPVASDRAAAAGAAAGEGEKGAPRGKVAENALGCDLEVFNVCPGSAGLVACLRGGSGSSEALGGGACGCFARALECFAGDQQDCPGRPSVEAAAQARGCHVTRSAAIDDGESIADVDTGESNEKATEPFAKAAMSQDPSKAQ
jgi:hypothetical protein